MLNQFRKHYPEGSLVSELVTIDHGKYIVRVLLQNNSITLSTGLAADEKIEMAEDRAIERALNSLKLEHKTVEVSEKIITQLSPPPQEIIAPKPTIETSSPPPEKTVEPVSEEVETKRVEGEIKPLIEPITEIPTKTSKKRVKAKSNSQKPLSIVTEIEEKYLPIVETSQKAEIEETPLPIAKTPQEIATEETPLPIAETPQEIATEETSPIMETPIEEEIEEIKETPPIEEEVLDFSEIIARSNVELKRLQWTTEQGRECLIRTYGKRSRQVLSDEELLEFLRYLESLPTPS